MIRVSRIVCRPRPSRYAISIDSTPIFKMRYCPATISPSRPLERLSRRIDERRDSLRLRGRLDDADELERNRRRAAAVRLVRSARRATTGGGGRDRRRRRRRRLRLEPEQIPIALDRLRPLVVERLEVHVGRGRRRASSPADFAARALLLDDEARTRRTVPTDATCTVQHERQHHKDRAQDNLALALSRHSAPSGSTPRARATAPAARPGRSAPASRRR